MGALSDYVETRFGVPVRSVTTNPTIGAAAAVQILNSDPDRFAFIVVNLDALEDVWIAFDNGVLNTRGIPLSSGGGFAVLTADEDLELVGLEVWAYSVGGSPLFIIETVAS